MNDFIKFEDTNRGFARGEFIDLYGCECSIQDSSLATDDAIWFGINDAQPQQLIPDKGWTPVEFPKDTIFNTRMHLNKEQVSALIEVLQRFVDTGSIREVDENGNL